MTQTLKPTPKLTLPQKKTLKIVAVSGRQFVGNTSAHTRGKDSDSYIEAKPTLLTYKKLEGLGLVDRAPDGCEMWTITPAGKMLAATFHFIGGKLQPAPAPTPAEDTTTGHTPALHPAPRKTPQVKAALRRANKPLSAPALAKRAGVAPATATRAAAALVNQGTAKQHQQGGRLYTAKRAPKLTSVTATPLVLAALQKATVNDRGSRAQTRAQLAHAVGCGVHIAAAAAASLVDAGKIWQGTNDAGFVVYVTHKPPVTPAPAPTLPPVGAVFETPAGAVKVVVWTDPQGGSALRMHDDTTPTKTTLSAWLRVDLTKREAAQHKIIVPHIEVAAREFTKIWWVQNDVAYRIILDSRFAEVDINNTLVVWRSTGGLVAAIALARYQATRAGYVLQVTPMDVGRAWAKYLNEDQPGRAIVLHALATPCAVRSNDQWAILTRRAMSHRHVLTALGQAVTAALTQPHTVVKPPTAEEIKRVMTEEGDNTINQIDIRFGQPHTMVKAAVEKLIASGAILVSPAGYLSWAPAPAPGPTAATLVKWGMVRAAVAAGHDTPTAVGNAVYLPQGEVNGILQTLTGFGLLDMTQAKHLSIPGAPLATITAQRGLTVQRWAVGAMALVVERTHDSAPVWHVDTPWGNLAKGHQGPALALWCVLTGKPDPDCAVAPVLAPDGSGLTWRGNKRQVWIMTQVAGSRGVALSGPRIVARVFPCAGAALRALLDSTGVDLLSPQAARIIF